MIIEYYHAKNLLHKNKDIIITNPGRGYGIVILVANDYVIKKCIKF